jgi:hypothetical protein
LVRVVAIAMIGVCMLIEWVGFNVDWFRDAAVLLLCVGLYCLLKRMRVAFVLGGVAVLIDLFVHLAVGRLFWGIQDGFVLFLLVICWWSWGVEGIRQPE